MQEGDRTKKFGPGTKIPPAWRDVMVTDDKTAPLQVVARDAAGRRQAIYSQEHIDEQAAIKFARIRLLDEHMPAVDAALSDEALGDDTAAAMMVIVVGPTMAPRYHFSRSPPASSAGADVMLPSTT